MPTDSSPTYSEDGEWMWNGNEWIPIPPNSRPNRRPKRIDKGKLFAIIGVVLVLIVYFSPEILERTRDSTDIYSIDTDGDGISDFDELNIGTDYLNPDTDGDGVIDGDEIRLGIDPLNPDTDSDGLNDSVDALPAHNFVVEFAWSVWDVEYNERCHTNSGGGGQITYLFSATTSEEVDENPLTGHFITKDGLTSWMTSYGGNYDIISHSYVVDFADEIYVNSETITIPVWIRGEFAGCDVVGSPCYDCIDLGPIGTGSFTVDLVIDKNVETTYTSQGERSCPYYGELHTPDDCVDDGYDWKGWIGGVSLTTTAMLL